MICGRGTAKPLRGTNEHHFLGAEETAQNHSENGLRERKKRLFGKTSLLCGVQGKASARSSDCEEWMREWSFAAGLRLARRKSIHHPRAFLHVLVYHSR